ncbi:MAG: phosphoribosylanthranilate isomerase [Planctomycetia bacterium]
MHDALFHVKVCGITTPRDAALVAAVGADAVGLNFVAGSPRQLDVAAARAVAAAVPRGVLKVGVFAGASADEVRATVEAVGLDAVQLHGHLFERNAAAPVDPPELCAALAGIPVIRAVRLDATGADALATARRWIARAAAAGAAPAMALVDAAVSGNAAAGSLGGTGEQADWAAVARAEPLPVPLALAGGLTPDNVAAAMTASRCRAVDAASGVESAPGGKDADRVRAFVAAARRALGLPAR